MIVLVPLPLFMSVPGIGDPGKIIVCGDPGLPLTKPGPRDVATLGDAGILGTVADGATTGGGEGMGVPEGVCATAGAAISVRVIAAQNLVIACSPETCPFG
jgi:hypothetical protein